MNWKEGNARLWIWLCGAAALVGLDQLVKVIVKSNIAYGEAIPVIPGFFYLTYYENSGAAWSLLQGQRWLFVGLSVIVAVIAVYMLSRKGSLWFHLPLMLILAGGVGNMVDRILTGRVVDFLEFHFGQYIFPVFNVADSCITVGAILLGLYLLILEPYWAKKSKREAE